MYVRSFVRSACKNIADSVRGAELLQRSFGRLHIIKFEGGGGDGNDDKSRLAHDW